MVFSLCRLGQMESLTFGYAAILGCQWKIFQMNERPEAPERFCR